MKKFFNIKTLLIVQTLIICFLIIFSAAVLSKKNKVIEKTNIVTAIPFVKETIKCSCEKNKNITKNILFIQF